MVDAVNSSFIYNPNAIGCSYPYFDDLDMNHSSYPMMGCCPGIGGSIFGSPMIGGGYMGYDPQAYFNNMKQYQQFANEYYIDNARNQRNADLKINAPMEGIHGKFTLLKDKITRGEEEQIAAAYRDFAAAVGRAYGSKNKADVNARAAATYAQLNGGTTLIEDLRQNSHDSFIQSLLHTVTLGLEDSKTAEDNISAITGTPVGRKDRDKKLLGRLAGAGVWGLTAKIAKNAACKKMAAKAAASGTTLKGIKGLLAKGRGTKTGLIAAGLALAISFFTD